MNSRGGFGSGSGHDNDLSVRLTDQVPIDFELEAGVAEAIVGHVRESGAIHPVIDGTLSLRQL